jgi:hypothetical protein
MLIILYGRTAAIASTTIKYTITITIKWLRNEIGCANWFEIVSVSSVF